MLLELISPFVKKKPKTYAKNRKVNMDGVRAIARNLPETRMTESLFLFPIVRFKIKFFPYFTVQYLADPQNI
jgi:hypothetical protein